LPESVVVVDGVYDDEQEELELVLVLVPELELE
jgi:hypothetical protein